MRCECPNCKKKLTLSADELSAQGGKVVCPRCLTVWAVPGFHDTHASQPGDATPPPVPAKPKRAATNTDEPPQLPKRSKATTPKAQPRTKQEISFVHTQQPAHQPRRAASAAAVTPSSTVARHSRPVMTQAASSANKPKTQKKDKSNHDKKPISTLGCALNTALAVIVFFAVYFLIGNLF